jgi:hypothetical protein
VYVRSSKAVAFRLDEESPKGKRNKASRLPNSAHSSTPGKRCHPWSLSRQGASD